MLMNKKLKKYHTVGNFGGCGFDIYSIFQIARTWSLISTITLEINYKKTCYHFVEKAI